MENEEIKNEGQEMIVKDFKDIGSKRKSKQEIFTNIEDKKLIFNLDTNVDYKINDCKGEVLRVKQVLIKRFVKDLDEPIVIESTGEIRDKEIKIVTILIDDQNRSYVTGSKSFGLQFIRFIEMFGIEEIEKGLEIRIIEKQVSNSNNKALGFELI